jgi:hypothetical protein
MSYEIPGFTRSYEAAGDLTTSYLKFVKLSGTALVAVAAATDDAIGVLQNKPSAAGIASTVMISGVTRAVNGFAGALLAGVPVYMDATGRVTSASSAGNCVGITETACAAQNEIVSVLLKPLGAVGA